MPLNSGLCKLHSDRVRGPTFFGLKRIENFHYIVICMQVIQLEELYNPLILEVL